MFTLCVGAYVGATKYTIGVNGCNYFIGLKITLIDIQRYINCCDTKMLFLIYSGPSLEVFVN